MGIDEELLVRKRLRDALVYHIHGHIDHYKMNLAKDIRSKSERNDAIAHVLRNAVIASPVIMFSGQPHVYMTEDGVYESIDWNDIGDALYDVMRKCRVKDGDYGRIDNITRLAVRSITNREFVMTNHAVVMGNGVFDTMDMKLHGFDPGYLLNSRLPYEYDPKAECNGWRRFLNEVLPDKEYQRLLQEFLAACFLDRRHVKIEQMLILLGSGANGKSVVFEVVSALFGEDCISHFSISDLIGQRREINLASVNGKRLNYCSEIRTSEINGSNSDAFKALISGEPQMARPLYHAPFRATSIPLMMANANTLPVLKEGGDAISRRILILPFDITIPYENQDRQLADSLKRELPGIFNWVIDGLKRMGDNKFGIVVPEGVKNIVSNYIEENSPIAVFCKSRGYHYKSNKATDKDSSWKHTKDLYDEYYAWCIETDEDALTRRQFSAEIQALGFRHERKASGWGFKYYKSYTEDEVLKMNMALAKEMELRANAKDIRFKHQVYSQKNTVVGVSMLEMYLGLPEGTVSPYLITGRLEGTYTRTDDGPKFDVYKAQEKLAREGFYSQIEFARNHGKATAKRAAASVKHGCGKTFNTKMRKLGLPFRKFDYREGTIPASEIGCILVPWDWEYSEKNARKLMKQIDEDGIERSVYDEKYVDSLT